MKLGSQVRLGVFGAFEPRSRATAASTPKAFNAFGLNARRPVFSWPRVPLGIELPGDVVGTSVGGRWVSRMIGTLQIGAVGRERVIESHDSQPTPARDGSCFEFVSDLRYVMALKARARKFVLRRHAAAVRFSDRRCAVRRTAANLIHCALPLK